MSIAGTTAITEMWAKCKAWFGRKLGASTTATTVSIQLKNNAGDNLGDAATISAATTTAAGAMSADDKTKLNGIATGATANSATTTTPKMDGTAAVGTETAYAKGDHVHPTDTSRAAATHSHGDITSGGDITATAPTIASGDKIIINDESAGKVTNGPSFGTSTTTYLRNDGTWETPAGTHPNQNAYSNVKVGSTTIAADSETDTLELAGSNVTLTPDATNDKVTIGITASNVTTALGNTAVARATADSNGNTFGAAASKAVDTSISAGSTSTNLPTTKAVSDFVAAQVTGATAFQGTVDSNATIEAASYVKGWYWVVATAGTYVGQSCEVGDMVFAIENKGASYSASDFSVVQNNVVEMTAAEVDTICV